MLQPAGDLGLEQEPLAADRVVGVVVEDLLQRHLAVQLAVEGDEDGAQAAPGVGPEDAEPLAVGRWPCRRRSWRCGRRRRRRSVEAGADVGERGRRCRGRRAGQALAGGAAGGEGGQALLGVAAVLLEVRGDQGLDGGPLVGVEVAAGDQVVGQRPGLVAGPGLEGGDELGLVDQAVLQGEQAEEQVAVGGHGGVSWISRGGPKMLAQRCCMPPQGHNSPRSDYRKLDRPTLPNLRRAGLAGVQPVYELESVRPIIALSPIVVGQ